MDRRQSGMGSRLTETLLDFLILVVALFGVEASCVQQNKKPEAVNTIQRLLHQAGEDNRVIVYVEGPDGKWRVEEPSFYDSYGNATRPASRPTSKPGLPGFKVVDD